MIASASKPMPAIAYLCDESTIHFLSWSRKRSRWRATGAIRQMPAAAVSSRVDVVDALLEVRHLDDTPAGTGPRAGTRTGTGRRCWRPGAPGAAPSGCGRAAPPRSRSRRSACSEWTRRSSRSSSRLTRSTRGNSIDRVGADRDQAADRRRARRRRGRRDRGREPVHRGDGGDGRRALGRAARRRDRRRRRGAARLGAHPGGRARRDAARGRDPAARPHRRARRADDARGRQAADRELRRDRLDRRRLRLLRRDRPRLRRPRDPLDRGEPARAGGQGPGRPGRLHRPLELPAAAAGLEARPGARRRQRDRLQAVGADPALDPRRRVVLRPPAGRASSTWSPAPATSAPRSSPTSGSSASPSPARSRPASGSPPSAPSGSPASTSRWAARTRSSSAPTSPTSSTSPPAAAPGPRS